MGTRAPQYLLDNEKNLRLEHFKFGQRICPDLDIEFYYIFQKLNPLFPIDPYFIHALMLYYVLMNFQ